jgi:BirA family biotin operon repressor/biotin-[acetyl-CoA-carboxylase] ligase
MKNELSIIRKIADGSPHNKNDLLNSAPSESQFLRTIRNIKEMGLSIKEENNCYRLDTPLELLNESIFYSHLKQLNNLKNIEISVDEILESTSDKFNPYDIDDKSIKVSIAEYQSSGRGRENRPWFSPFGSGICFSIFQEIPKIKSPIGLSVFLGIKILDCLENLGLKGIKVKWPNDFYFNNKKLGGLLIELNQNSSDNLVATVGLGINYLLPSNLHWDDILSHSAIDIHSIKGDMAIGRNFLAANLINTMIDSLDSFNDESLKDLQLVWRNLDMLFGQQLKIQVGDDIYQGIDSGIDNQGQLILDDNGISQKVISGHILEWNN